MDEIYLREEMLLGSEAMKKLKSAHVAVFGLGGVGSWCAESLARAGVGKLTLIDSDTFSYTNINRQSEALFSTVGRPKAEVMAARIADINPEIEIIPMTGLYNAENRHLFFPVSHEASASAQEVCSRTQAPFASTPSASASTPSASASTPPTSVSDPMIFASPRVKYDFVADCIDLVSCKLDLIMTCRSLGIPIISALGTGNKKDAQQMCITDISKTYGDALARVMRKELRSRGVEHHTVVFSPEEPLEPEQREAPPPGRRSVPGSLVWVPAAAGLLMTQHIVIELISYDTKQSDYC